MMQSSSRIHRSRRWKMKHVLQIVVIVAICIWLAYEVKISNDRRKSPEDGSSKLTERSKEEGAGLKLGRKGAPGNVVIIDTDNETPSEVEELDVVAEGTSERKNMHEGKEGGSGDQSSSVHQDLEDVDGSSQEAREEQYRADDASSAVVRDTIQEETQENEERVTENFEEHKEKIEQEERKSDGWSNLTEDSSRGEEVQEDHPVDGVSQQFNNTVPEIEDGSLSNSSAALGLIDHHVEEHGNGTSSSDDQMEQQSSSTEAVPDDLAGANDTSAVVNVVYADSTPENATLVEPATDQEGASHETGGIHTGDKYNSGGNSTVRTMDDDRNEQQNNNTADAGLAEEVETQNVTGDALGAAAASAGETVSADMASTQDQMPVTTRAMTAEGNSNSVNPEGNEGSGDGSEESAKSSSSTGENGEAGEGEAISLSGGIAGGSTDEEQRDARTDPSTLLPEAETTSAEGAAAE